MADVGDEVAADLLESAALGDVLDERDDAERAAAVVDLAGPHLERSAGWPVEIERALGQSLVPGVLEDLGHRLGGQGIAVAADHQGIGAPVAVDHRAVLVAEDHALGEGVERAPEADGVGAGLGHRLGGAARDLLEVGEGGLDVVLVLGRVEAEPAAERRQPLRDRPPPRTPSEHGGHESDQHADGNGNDQEQDLLGPAQIDLPHRMQRHVPNMTGLERARRPSRWAVPGGRRRVPGRSGGRTAP